MKKKSSKKNLENPRFLYLNKDAFYYSRVKGIDFVDYKPSIFMRSQVNRMITRIVGRW